MKPLCIDLFCGLGGWSSGFLDAGYHCRGYDVEAHDYGSGGYPGELVLRDVRSIHGSEFKDAACIVASPPCQEYSYMAMPWSIAKQKAAAIRADATGAMRMHLTDLFNQCWRLQREACEAAGHYIPMVVENVRGAQPWVGRAKANFGSFYLWGDVGMVGNRVVCVVNGKLLGYGVRPMKAAKVPGFRFDGSGGSFQSAAVKVASAQGRRTDPGKGARFTTRDCGDEAIKVPGMNWSDRDRPAQGFNVTAAQRYREGVKFEASSCLEWFDGKPKDKMLGDKGPAAFGSKSNSRKAASALIAKIPFALSSHIARAFKP